MQIKHNTKNKLREAHLADQIFYWVLKLSSIALTLVLFLIAVFLYKQALPAIKNFGWRFLHSSVWDPVKDTYGSLPVIYGTVVSSLIAITIATPLSIGVALFLTEIAPKHLSKIVGFLVEMLAAIPSVVYGLWGIFVLAPWLRRDVEPFLASNLGFLPFFQGPPYGVGMLCAGIILAIMITPTISSICREIFHTIPQIQRESALALGATKWEMMQLSVLKSTKKGITGAVILGLGRALGETMAVTMVIGNRHDISLSFFAPSSTMASIIANEYAEATTDMHVAALVEIGFVLLAVTFVINSIARIFISRGFRWTNLFKGAAK